ncbi:MAG: CvpA family protein [Oscillospiraceae bacterium]|nr:CvpA family protein [Oscillospiraceae bacterium]MBQ4544804.1 CvpA family protein [Oscillospiraceae bacterium]
MTISSLAVDIITLAILVFSALRGRHKGLIKTVAGIAALIISFSAAGFLAKETAPYISEKYISPYITSAVISESTDTEATPSQATSEAKDIFLSLGISDSIINDAISDFTAAMTKSIVEPLVAMSNSVAYRITYYVLFVIYFLLSLLVVSLLLKIVNLASRVPGINFVNKTLGLILGLIMGYLIIMVLSHLLVKFGILLNDDILNDTKLLNALIRFSPTMLIGKFLSI